MSRNAQYAILFAVLALLQIFLFNNLTLSIYLAPLVYITFIALLPMETSQLVMLLLGLFTGFFMDWTMGMAGINTITTVFVAFTRIHLLFFIGSKENIHDGGVPSPRRLGRNAFRIYLALFFLIHNGLFFFLEALSLSHVSITLARTIVSATAGVLFALLISHLFTAQLSRS
jgi:hypothetical protein